MWEEKMTQEEDDLEEELNSLDIREDHGAEDSDVTPINTPPITPPMLYIKKYPPVKPPQNDAILSFPRYPKAEEFDCRSESSLSWGDDEFEEEATKQVGILFDQVDFLLYQEKAAVPTPNSAESVSNNPLDLLLYNKNLCDSNDNTEKVSLSESVQSDEGFEEIHSGTSKQSYGYVEERHSSEEALQSPQKIFYYGKFMESSTRFNIEHLLVSDPSPELQDECSNWVEQFPHFRVRGVSVDPVELREQEDYMSKDQILQEDGLGVEETVACDGDFEHLLPLVVYTSANQKKVIAKEPSKQVTSNSRVCSGSNDPEVLKEQVFFILFDKLWETVTKRIEPLLYQYARYIIEQSVQYSSLSREPSTRGSRIGSHRVSQKVNDDNNTNNNNSLLPSHITPRPLSGTRKSVDRVNRPLSGIRRPSSALYRLQNSLVMPDIHQDELKELLQVSPKPLQSANNRMQSLPSSTSQIRGSSALSSRSYVSLPAVTTPRDNVQRPLSSKNLGNHLTPRRNSSYYGSGEQRPSSTSSSHTRMRFQEKFQNLNRQSAIQELGTETTGYEKENGPQEQPSPVWSRHIPFLPPIPDNAVIPIKHQLQQSSANTRENRTQPMLYVKGATMSATHRSDARIRSSKALCGIPIIESGGASKGSVGDKNAMSSK